MKKTPPSFGLDTQITLGIALLLIIGLAVLRSISPSIFPGYLIYIFLGLLFYYLTTRLDFRLFTAFSKHFYVISLVLLSLSMFIGEITRGTIRWIQIGTISFQPSELIRPFLLIFFADFLTKDRLDFKRTSQAFALALPPIILIIIQPSLGVAIITLCGLFGVLLASKMSKKNLALFLLLLIFASGFSYPFLAPYQKSRILTFLDPEKDPYGAGYNSIQSMVSVGSGRLFGRGLGKGVQTQLSFLPERHTDFVFASIAEELGLIGAVLVLAGFFIILSRLISILENPINPTARVFVSGLFLVLFVQVVVNVGMNMGLFPVTGIPLPFVSAGGSSLIATMLGLGMAARARKI